MSKQPENIDSFFKNNLEKIEVKFNAAHWETMEKSLLAAYVGIAASHTNAANSNAVSISAKTVKTLLILISSIGIISIAVLYFANKKQEKNSIPVINKDSIIIKHNESLNITNSTSIKNTPAFSPASPSLNDTSKIIQPNIFPLPLEKSSVSTHPKDTIHQKNKKLNLFW